MPTVLPVNVLFQAEQVKQSIGDVTILVNNAGIFKGGLFTDENEKDIQNTFAVNALSHIWVSLTERYTCIWVFEI